MNVAMFGALGAYVGLGLYLHYIWEDRVHALPPRKGASWSTLLKRRRYRGSRKARNATRCILSALARKRGEEKARLGVERTKLRQELAAGGFDPSWADNV